MKGTEERSGELVIAGGDGAADLEVTDHALDAVALAVEALVPANDGGAVGFGRDDVADAVGLERGANGVGVVTPRLCATACTDLRAAEYLGLIREDLGFIPSFADWARCIRPEPWMGRAQPIHRDVDPFAAAG